MILGFAKKVSFSIVDKQHKNKTQNCFYDNVRVISKTPFFDELLECGFSDVRYIDGWGGLDVVIETYKNNVEPYKQMFKEYKITETKTDRFGDCVEIQLTKETFEKIKESEIQIHYRQDCYKDKTIIYSMAKLYTIADLEKIIEGSNRQTCNFSW